MNLRWQLVRRDEPQPEPQPARPRGYYFDDATMTWRNWELDESERVRVKNLEARLALEREARSAPDMSGFVYRGPDVRPANLPSHDG
jgi:hypothetical protein